MTLIKDNVDPGESTSSQSWFTPFKLTRLIVEDEGTFECALRLRRRLHPLNYHSSFRNHTITATKSGLGAKVKIDPQRWVLINRR